MLVLTLSAKQRAAACAALREQVATLERSTSMEERREGQTPAAARRAARLSARLAQARDALHALEHAPDPTADGCQSCMGPIKKGQRYVVVTPVGKLRGETPPPDGFHARCGGAFRDGWGA